MRTEAGEWRVAEGEYDFPPHGEPEGTADQWANGTLHSVYEHGGYGPLSGCVSVSRAVIITDGDSLHTGGGPSMGSSVTFDDDDLAGVQAFRSEGEAADLADADTLLVDFDSPAYDSPAYADADVLECEAEASVPVGPGATCGTAGTMTLGTGYTYTVPAMGVHWWTFPVTNGTTYRVRYVRNSGGPAEIASLYHGSCPTPTLVGSLSLAGCQQFTAGSGEAGYVRIDGDPAGPTNYTITPDAGTCP